MESGEYIEKVFPFFGVRFIAVNDQVDTLYKPADIGVQLKNMVNEMYAKDISRKITSTVRALQEQGKFIGGHPPYGYKRKADDKYSLEIDPEVAPFVREAYEKIIAGYTIHGIVLEFNDRGIPSPGRYKHQLGLLHDDKYKNSVWFFSTMKKILSDYTYIGWIQNGKYQYKKINGIEKQIKVPKDEWIIFKDSHEAIISEELFFKVQGILEQNKKGANIGKYASKGNVNNLFRGKLKCGECGKSMALRKKKNGEQIQYWYICPMHEHYNSSYCQKKAIKKEQLDALILALIKKQMQLFLEAKSIVQDLNCKGKSQNKYKIYLSQIQRLEKEIAQYSKMKAEKYSDYVAGIITQDEYKQFANDYSVNAAELEIFLNELRSESEKYSPEGGSSKKWEELVQKFIEQEQLDRPMVDAFIETITLYNDSRTEVVFKYSDEIEHILLLAAERKREAVRYA